MKKNITLLIFLLFSFTLLANARVYYVKVSGNDNLSGISWSTAFATLEKAITTAQAGDEIWVAAGNYTPQRSLSAYRLKSNVSIYGGFAGFETSRTQRDWERNVTVLYGNRSSVILNDFNARLPLVNAVLDGFTLKGGTGSAVGLVSPSMSKGGAIHNIYASMTIANCIITQCSAKVGGGIYNENSTSILINSTISQCEAESGGGIANLNSDLDLKKVIIEECSAYNGNGGAILTGAGNIAISNSKLNFNKASGGGGGLCGIGDNTTVKITDTKIQANHASEGAGISYNYRTNVIYMVNVLMTGNSAVNQGGALLLKEVSGVELTGVTIAGNYAGERGGGIIDFVCPSDIEERVRIYKINNSIIWGNSTDAGDYRYDNITAFDNCSGLGLLYPSFNIQNCLVERCFDGLNWNPWVGISGGGNINRNPMFVNYILAGQGAPTDQGDYHLLMGSPAINAGSNALSIGAYDLDGNSRILQGTVDMGPYESNYPAVTRIYVNESQTALREDGTSWATAYRTLSAALSQIQWSRERAWEIWVAKGVYNAGRQSYTMINKVAIYGGFAGNETRLEQRNWESNETILAADYVPVIMNSFSEAYKLDTTAVLDGFIIMKGGDLSVEGGGVYNKYASPVIRNCTIQHCYGSYGGGMYNVYSNPVIYNTVFRENFADYEGGGIYNISSNPVLVNVSLVNNNSRTGGGGMFNGKGSKTIMINNLIACNYTDGEGGGVLNEDAGCTMINTTVSGNFAEKAAGLRNRYNSGPTLINLANSIVWGNNIWPRNALFLTRDNIINDLNNRNCVINIAYSFIERNIPSWPAEYGRNLGYNVDGDPGFVDYRYVTSRGSGILGDYHQTLNSGAINGGNNGFNNYRYDLDGRPRILQGTIDMGTYEYGRAIMPEPIEPSGGYLWNMAQQNANALARWIASQGIVGPIGEITESTSPAFPFTDNNSVASANGSMDVYPNPVNNGNQVTINVSVPDQDVTGITVDVYNMLGERISSRKFPGQSASVEMPATSGTYFVKVMAGNGFVKTEKIIVM